MIAESVDKSALLIGEVKWTKNLSVDKVVAELQTRCEELSAILPDYNSKQIIKAIFTKVKPAEDYPGILIFGPEDLI